jgi:hypothetical protein
MVDEQDMGDLELDLFLVGWPRLLQRDRFLGLFEEFFQSADTP